MYNYFYDYIYVSRETSVGNLFVSYNWFYLDKTFIFFIAFVINNFMFHVKHYVDN